MEIGSSGSIFISPKTMSLFFVLFLLEQVSNALVGPRFMVAQLGGSVNITCQYTTSPVNIYGRKFWCKMSKTNSVCSTVTSTTKYVGEDYKGRVRLVDSPSTGTFQVEMAQLKSEDSGRYRCGIGQNNNGFFFSVVLAVSGGPNVNDHLEVVHGVLRGSVTIRCRFNKSNIDKMYWCKMDRTGGCRIIADTAGYMEQRYKGRILIVPGVNPNVFKILINQLLEEDAGWYRCGISTFNNHGRWKDIQMHISKDSSLPEKTTILYRPQGGSVAIECRNDTQLKNGDKYMCKWKGKTCTRLIDNAGFVDEALVERLSLLAGEGNSTTYSVLMTDLREEDAGWYWCVAINGSNDITSSIELQILKERPSLVPMNETTATSKLPSPISTVQNHSTDYENMVVTFDRHSVHTTTSLSRKETTTTPKFPSAISKKQKRSTDYKNTAVTFDRNSERGSCKRPPRFQFGELYETFINRNVFPVGSKVTYKCRPGYVTIRRLPKTVTCRKTLQWTEIQEFCEPRNCGNPGELLNGDVKSQEGADGPIDTKFGSTVTFVCNPGFNLVGRNKRTCTASGWNNAIPICEVVICPKPPDIPNGIHTSMGEEEFQYQNGVTYSCNSKTFSLVGEASIYCTADGDWSSPAPKCKVVSCTSPHVPHADRISGFGASHTFKETVWFACKAGFVMIGRSLIECGEDNQWHPPVPVCQLPAKSTTTRTSSARSTSQASTISDVEVYTVESERRPTLIRSSTTSAATVPAKSTPTSKLSASFNSQASTISDVKVFSAEGEREATLIRGSTTDDEEAATDSCKRPPRFQFGEIPETFINRNVFPVGTKVTYKCRPGYVTIRRLPKTVTCLKTLQWTEIQEFCERRNCGNPGELLNGDVQFHEGADGQIDAKFGSSVTFVCNQGFRLNGSNKRTCTASGWNNALPNCEEVICPKPPDIPNGMHTSVGQEEFRYQNGITYSCNSKTFSLIGAASIYCTADGDWSSPAPKCKVVSCTSPHVPNADRISGFGASHTFKDTVGFACKAGFVMIGRSLIECGEDNQWHPSVPACQLPSKSPHRRTSSVSATSQASTISDVQVYTVESGRGPMLIRSSTTETATGSCKHPPRFQFGELSETFINRNVFPVGTKVIYKCRPGYVTMQRLPKTVTCLETLKWTEIQEFCERRNCGNPGELINGDVKFQEGPDGQIDTKFGSSVTFVCNRGFELAGINKRTCTASGWNYAHPNCEAVICPKPPVLTNGMHLPVGQEKFQYQNGVTYRCNSKTFSLIGAASIYCTADGDWSGPAPKCKVVSCTSPHVPNADRISGFGVSHTFKDTVGFACKAGFVMIGRSLIECGEDNQWHPPVPACQLPAKSTPTSKLSASFTRQASTVSDVQVFTVEGEREHMPIRGSTADDEEAATVLAKSTPTSISSASSTNQASTVSADQVYTAEHERGPTLIRSSTTVSEKVVTVSEITVPSSQTSKMFSISDLTTWRQSAPARRRSTTKAQDEKTAAELMVSSSQASKIYAVPDLHTWSESLSTRLRSTAEALNGMTAAVSAVPAVSSQSSTSFAVAVVKTDIESRTASLRSTTEAADTESAKDITIFYSGNTIPTASKDVIFLTDSRGHNESLYQARTSPATENPHRGDSAPDLHAHSNHTIFKDGWEIQDRSLLMFVVPSLGLVLVLLLLLGAGAIIAIRARRRWKNRVRQPVSANGSRIAMAETKCLQEGAGPGCTSMCGDEEKEVDLDDVSKGLMQKATFTSFTTDT